MAIYKGRSVQIISAVPQAAPKLTVAHKDGSTSVVSPADLQFTKVELDKIQKTSSIITDPNDPNYNHNYKLIEDKDHQELLDGQDPKKMEEKMKKQPNAPVVTIPTQTLQTQAPQATVQTEAQKASIDTHKEQVKEQPKTPFLVTKPSVK